MPRIDERVLLEPANRTEWRAWLERNHATSPGVWLAVGKKGNRVTALTYDDAVEEALCFGWIDSTVRRLDADRFRQLLTPRRPGSVWAKSNKERVERLAGRGLMWPAGLAAVETAKADGSWNISDEIESLAVPTDLAHALTQAPAAEEGYHALPESVRKQVLYWIASAKRPETRARRIAETVEAAGRGTAPR